MNILDQISIRLPCNACGKTYEVPLSDVLLSHTMVRMSGKPGNRMSTGLPDSTLRPRCDQGLQQRVGETGRAGEA
jgi:hypothetical protein